MRAWNYNQRGMRGLGTLLTAGGAAEPTAKVLAALEPGSQAVKSIEQLGADRGRFIYLAAQGMPLYVGILGFTAATSKGPLTTIFYTYGPKAGQVDFHNTMELIAGGWRIADPAQSAAAYRAGAVTMMPRVPAPSMDALGAAIEGSLALLDEIATLIRAGNHGAATPKLAQAEAELADASWHLGFMLDTGHMSRKTFASIKNLLDSLVETNTALKTANLSSVRDIDGVLASAVQKTENAFTRIAKDTVSDAETYAGRAQIMRNLRDHTQSLLALARPFQNDPQISPLVRVLELDSVVLDEVVQELQKEDAASAADFPAEGDLGLGATAGLGRLGIWLIRLWRGRRFKTAQELINLAARGGKIITEKEAMQLIRGGLRPGSWLQKLVGWGKKTAGFLLLHVGPMWYFFAPNSPLHKEAAAEMEKRSLAFEIAARRFEELLAKGMATKDALVKMKEYMKEIENQLEIDPVNLPDIPGLDPMVAAAKAKVMAKLGQDVEAKADKAEGKTTTQDILLYVGLGGAAAVILYLLLSKKSPQPATATPATLPRKRGRPRKHPV